MKVHLGVLMVLGLTLSSTAKEPEPIRSVVGIELRVADVLPAPLAEFVVRHDNNRPLDATLQSLINEMNRDPAATLEVLRPQDYMLFTEPVTLQAARYIHSYQVSMGEEGVVLVAGTDVLLADGTTTPLGNKLALGDVVEHGTVVNAGYTPVVVEGTNGPRVWHPGDAIVILKPTCDPKPPDVACQLGGPGATSCRLTCETGATGTSCQTGCYACCWSDSNGNARSGCFLYGEPE